MDKHRVPLHPTETLNLILPPQLIDFSWYTHRAVLLKRLDFALIYFVLFRSLWFRTFRFESCSVLYWNLSIVWFGLDMVWLCDCLIIWFRIIWFGLVSCCILSSCRQAHTTRRTHPQSILWRKQTAWQNLYSLKICEMLKSAICKKVKIIQITKIWDFITRNIWKGKCSGRNGLFSDIALC